VTPGERASRLVDLITSLIDSEGPGAGRAEAIRAIEAAAAVERAACVALVRSHRSELPKQDFREPNDVIEAIAWEMEARGAAGP
jgi:hypothetical protein